MGKFINITGQRFGRLVAVRRLENSPQGRVRWLCRCDCGGITIVTTSDLNSGNSASCGCVIKQKMRDGLRTTHGQSGTAEHRTWKHMHGRCYTITDRKYSSYGGRGIYIVERWHSFENFLTDMGRKPGPGYSIERLDNDGPYSPENCIWADAKTQARNKSNSIKITYQNETKTLSEWALCLNLPYATLLGRILRGWSFEDTLSLPIKSSKKKKTAIYGAESDQNYGHTGEPLLFHSREDLT